MSIQATLLLQTGTENFDPWNDLLLSEKVVPTPFLTWRPVNAVLPTGSKVEGVFVSDGCGNISFQGDVNRTDVREYVGHLTAKVARGEEYYHSPYHRLFSRPTSIQEMLDKISKINYLYFPDGTIAEDPERCAPDFTPAESFSLEVDGTSGVIDLRHPVNPSRGTLLQSFSETIQSLRGIRDNWLVRPIYR